MQDTAVPILLFTLLSTGLGLGLLGAGKLLGPKRQTAVKQMPYESGMDPIHDTRRRFDIGFYLVAIVFLVFDVELLFLYPWAVASRAAAAPEGVAAQQPLGIDSAVALGWVEGRGLVFTEVMVFIALLAAGLLYVWKKGVFRWR
jgi:NADH-quinone oxidoreductase subunit A